MRKFKRANEYFGISEGAYKKEGAFNPVIGVDSLFFIDPLLLSKTSTLELKDGLQKVRKYFSDVILLIKTNNSRARQMAFRKLIFRELRGVGIGYGNSSDDGSAIGPELAQKLLLVAEELIEMGITNPAIFEVMGLFTDNFGPDRLSDALIRILRNDLFEYTERITKKFSIKNAVTLKTYERDYIVPCHPFQTKPLIFVPEDILRDLPVAHSYGEIAELAIFNEELRERFNRLIAPCFITEKNKKPSKKEIKKYLLSDKNKISTLIEAYESCSPSSYDFDIDPAGLYLWLEKAKKLVKQNPLRIISHPKGRDLTNIIQDIIDAFKKFIETKGGWRSLYDNKMRPLNESHARHFFYATAVLYCKACDIDISPESNAGRGPVDFKLSRGHSNKIIVEVKLTSGNVYQGYEKQTRIYQESEEAKESYYIVVQVTEKSKALENILEFSDEEEEDGKLHPTIIVVDGTKKLSASNA